MARPRWVDLSKIIAAKRPQVWEMLQRDYPHQAALVRDPFVQQCRELFNATIIIELPAELEKPGHRDVLS
jgi:hypothetical protein